MVSKEEKNRRKKIKNAYKEKNIKRVGGEEVKKTNMEKTSEREKINKKTKQIALNKEEILKRIRRYNGKGEDHFKSIMKTKLPLVPSLTCMTKREKIILSVSWTYTQRPSYQLIPSFTCMTEV